MSSAPALTYVAPRDAAALAHNFRVFAEIECARTEPLYRVLANAIAEDAELLALHCAAPYSQRRPVLFFAATHDLILRRVPGSAAIARFYRSAGGEASPDEAFGPFRAFCLEQHAAITTLLQTRATQTNETGRGAGLALALSTLAPQAIALIDIGCSAGLNLYVDRYRYTFIPDHEPTHEAGHIGPEEAKVRIETRLIGAYAPARYGPIPAIAQRTGIDIEPLDPANSEDALWLQACVWPSDTRRAERLENALDLARSAVRPQDRVRRLAGTARERLAEALQGVPDGVRPVLFHSWAATYFSTDDRAAFVAQVEQAIIQKNAVWISQEGAPLARALGFPEASLEGISDPERREGSLWHLARQDGAGGIARHLLARSHPHCAWLEWLQTDLP